MPWTPQDIARMIDHSLLRPELTPEEVVKGCAVAKKYGTATVCCTPADVALCKRELAGSPVKVAAVVGFPNGYSTTEAKVFEAERAIADGAEELDMVLHIGRLLGGDLAYVRADVKAVCDAAHARGARVKVILENCYLTDLQKVAACKLCEEAGADWVKTSTGFGKSGATLPDLKLMKATVSEKVQVKAAGGVRDLDMALAVRAIGCTRFGATATEAIMEEAFRRGGGE
ncbi:MAG TPA: deoxyribose-phosphate aldolase [Anaeromyxobacter sp.]|nr:deoxyribose-phosphate aldolase [Anaeromyxobacter sp.]